MDKKKIQIAVAAVVLVAGAVAGYFYWQQSQPQPVPVQAKAPMPVPRPAPQPQPEVQPQPALPPVVAAPPAQPALPKLSQSDRFMLDNLATLVGNPSLMKLFRTERIIRNIVATVDNLPREKVPVRVMPLKPVPGAFLTTGTEDSPVIDPKNAERYAPYLKLVMAMDSKKLVDTYVRLYPLFQQAYEQLGYPKGYFNNRLLEAIDDLLEAPEVEEPVNLVQPHVQFLYADPELEASPAGQKILMRMGSQNAAKIKAKLREIKQEVLLRVQDGKIQAR